MEFGWSNINKEKSLKLDRVSNEAGSLIFSQDSREDEYGSEIPLDKSSVMLVDKFKSSVGLVGGDVYLVAQNDMVQRTNKNYHFYCGGGMQFNIRGSKHEYIQGDHTIQVGRQTNEEVEASRRLNEIVDEIGDETVKAINDYAGKGDRVTCNVCSLEMEVDRGARMVSTAFKYIRKIFKILPNSPLGGIVEKIEKVLRTVLGFFLDSIPVSAMNGGSCGSSGCKNGTVASPLGAIQKGNEVAASKFDQHKKEIEELELKLDRSVGTQIFPNNLAIQVGLHFRKCKTVAHCAPLPIITELVDGNPKYCFIPSSKSTCKKATYVDQPKTTGAYTITSNEYRATVGSNGYWLSCNGKISLIGSCIDITSDSEGEINISTNNKVQIGGANIVLTSKGNANGDAIVLDSDRVYVGGKLSVQGDIALKGSLMMDGSIYTTHLTCPGERVETEISSSAHNVHSAANWNNPIKPDATKMDIFDKIYKVLRDIGAFLIGLVLTPDFLKTKIEETYSTIRIDMFIDNYALETGYAWVIQYPARLPVQILGVCTNGGAVTGTVIPAMIPVYSFTHNHGSPGDPHYHGYTTPQTEPYGSNAAAIAVRQPASHVPTPAKQTGMGTKPGHKSNGDLGPCGGGGGFFGNTGRINSAKIRRNQTYGINSNDAFAGKDYVDIDTKFNPDGTIYPTPDLNIADCD